MRTRAVSNSTGLYKESVTPLKSVMSARVTVPACPEFFLGEKVTFLSSLDVGEQELRKKKNEFSVSYYLPCLILLSALDAMAPRIREISLASVLNLK